MQRRVFLAGLAGGTATLAGCSALGGGGGGGGGGGSGRITITNEDIQPHQLSVEVASGDTVYYEDSFSVAISGDSATQTIEQVFEDESPDTATVTVVVDTDDPVTHEWNVGERATLEATIAEGGDLTFGGAGGSGGSNGS
jgi:hypothetical protein